jgi:TolB-like protein
MPTPSLLQRLKERKLVQWGLAYLAGAFVVLQLLDALEGALGLTPTIQRAILVVVSVGFFVTLVLAWYHGEKGRQRVSGPELLMVAALLVVAGVALTLLNPQEEGFTPVALEGDDRPGIAVFPCENWSPNPDDAYFASGIHDEILLRLSGISGLRSIGRETMEWYDERSLPTRQVAQELAVGYLGECSVLKDAGRNQIRLTFQLIDGNTGTQLWAENYDEDLTARSIFDIHSDLARRIARAIGAALTPEERARVDAEPTDNFEALNAYLIGRHWWNERTAEGLERAIQYFEESVRIDSTFALAYVGLAETYVLTPWYGPFIPTPEARQKAFYAGQRALEIDPGLGEAHTALALAAHTFDWDWEAAEEGYLEAIRLNPGYATAHHWYGILLAYLGRYEEAIASMRIAVDLEPLSPIINTNVGFIQYYAGRYDDAVEQYLRTLELFPDFGVTHRMLGRVYLKTGRYDLARERLRGTAYLSFLHSAEGEFDEARAVVEQTDTGSLRSRLIAYAGIGDLDRVFSIADSALEIHAPWIIEDPINDPIYEVLRSDPRFEEIVRRVGLRD